MTQQDIQKLDPSEVITLTGKELKTIVNDICLQVIGEDEYIPPTKPITKFSKPSSVDYRNSLRDEQRQALQDTLGINT